MPSGMWKEEWRRYTVNGKGIFWNTCVNEVLKALLKIYIYQSEYFDE